MIDLNEIRNDPNLIGKKLKKRNFNFDEKFFISSENERKKMKVRILRRKEMKVRILIIYPIILYTHLDGQ